MPRRNSKQHPVHVLFPFLHHPDHIHKIPRGLGQHRKIKVHLPLDLGSNFAVPKDMTRALTFPTKTTPVVTTHLPHNHTIICWQNFSTCPPKKVLYFIWAIKLPQSLPKLGYLCFVRAVSHCPRQASLLQQLERHPICASHRE